MISLAANFLAPIQLDAYAAVGKIFFPSEDWLRGISRVGRMLAKWPRGIFCVWDGPSIIGYMSLWPLTDTAARRLETADLTDDGIDTDSLPDEVRPPHRCWIMTAVAIVPQDKDLRREIMRALLGLLHATMEANRPCRIYAHAVTGDGQRFCRRTGFVFDFPAAPPLCCLYHP